MKRPAGAGQRAASSRRKVPAKDQGISMFSVVLAIMGVGCIVLTFMTLAPRDLSHIAGYPADRMSNKEPRNILTDAQNLLRDMKDDISFTEKEVNDYLNHRFLSKQGGALGKMMAVRGIYVDLKKDQAEIFLERSMPIFGRNTVSTVIRSEYNPMKREYYWIFKGSSAGKITLPMNLMPIQKLFGRFQKIGKTELEVLDHMVNVKFEDDKLTLQTRIQP